MKNLVAYSIWNKQDMLNAIMTGILVNFNPNQTDVLFIFDGCSDKSLSIFMRNYGIILQNFDVHYIINPTEEYEYNCQNKIIEFMLNNNYEYVIIFQDDELLGINNIPVILQKIFSLYGNFTGLVGGRDGFNIMFKNGIGSEWSEPLHSKIKYLNTEQFEEVLYLNNGPMVFKKSMVEKIGFLDTNNFTWFYGEIDYCIRCIKAGFKNVVFGTDIVHTKFGKVSNSKIYDNITSAKDLKNLHKKWGYV